MDNDFKKIIAMMGYEGIPTFHYYSELQSLDISHHSKKVISEIKPYAFYTIDSKPLILFFDKLNQREELGRIKRKIWNSQIPLFISDEGSSINIYCSRDVSFNNEDIHFNILNKVAKNKNSFEDEMRHFSPWNINSERFLDDYKKALEKKSVNEYLIENLKFITDLLKNEYRLKFGNQLILRILFIRYLIDRGIDIGFNGFDGNVDSSRCSLLNVLNDKETLYELFKYLKEKFNGNLFEISKEEINDNITNEVLNFIQMFLSADISLNTGQLSLFPFYDFDVIPVELISNVYEVLLGERQEADKAFYTPEYLVDLMLVDTVNKKLDFVSECSVVDPSCGSGIFLVKSLRMILDKNADEDGYISNNDKINRIVKDNIFGIDCNPEAIDITIFSIYITLFDFKNPKELQNYKFPNLKNENILPYDFFDKRINELFNSRHFDFVIGNPPWGKISGQNAYIQYMKNIGVKLPNKEISIAFVMRLMELCKGEVSSLILPSKILYNDKKPSVDIRGILLNATKIIKIIELSSVRKILFKGAIAPAIILTFESCNNKENQLNNKFEYISLKPNKILNYYKLIMIEPEDVKFVTQMLLFENDWAWKTIVYGSYWDFDNVLNLKSRYKTLGEIGKDNGLIFSKGIQDNDSKTPQDASHLLDRKFLSSKDTIEHFWIDIEKYTKFDKQYIHRARTPELFEPPYVLFKKGVDSNFSIRAGFCDIPFVYKEAISCIKGTQEQECLLKNLTGLLNSSLYTYLNLLLGSSIAIEREQVFLTELKRFPYIYCEELVNSVNSIGKVQGKIKISDQINAIDEIVLDAFNLKNNLFIDYILNYQIPRLKGSEKPYLVVENSALEIYKNYFIDTWNDLVGVDSVPIDVSILDGKYDNIILLVKFIGEDSYAEIGDLSRFMLLSEKKIIDSFYQTKNIIEFHENCLYIVKKNYKKNWHSSRAIIDCSEIVNTILTNEGEGE